MQKTILVTGAGKGIGYEIAIQAANLGHTVLGISRNCSSLIGKSNIIPIQLDLTHSNFESTLLQSVQNTTIDCVINNAGLFINKPFLELTDEDWNAQWLTNVMGPVRILRTLINNLASNAHIVNISSMGGFQGSSKFPGLSAYSSTKAAIAVLSECLTEEIAFKGMSVNALCLGAAQTEMLEQAFPGYKAPVTAQEMAHFVLDFALNSGSYLNGKIIPVAKNNPN